MRKVLNGTQTVAALFAPALMERPSVHLRAAPPSTAYTPLKPLVRPDYECVRVVFNVTSSHRFFTALRFLLCIV